MSRRPTLDRTRDTLTSRAMPEGQEGPREPDTRDENADQAAVDALYGGTEPIGIVQPEAIYAPPPFPIAAPAAASAPINGARVPGAERSNAMQHGYRVLTAEQDALLLRAKDQFLGVWETLHEIDGTSPESFDFAARELWFASMRLEEAMSWVEKYFHV